jgi:hypothetical protein
MTLISSAAVLHCLLSSYFLPQTRNASPDSRIETRYPNVAPMVQMLSTRRSNDLVLIFMHHGVHNRGLVAVKTVSQAEWSTCHLFDQ